MSRLKPMGPWRVVIKRDGFLPWPQLLVREFGLRAGDEVVLTPVAGSISTRIRFYRHRRDGRWTDLIRKRIVKRLPTR